MPAVQTAPGPYPPEPPGGYGVVGPDGREYFSILPEIRGLVDVWVQGLRLVNELRALPHPAARPKARLLAAALTELEKKVKAGEIGIAQETDHNIRTMIRATQARPDRSGRMAKGIESRPIRPLQSPLPLFAIGQVDIAKLDAATTERNSGKSYWRSQEFGYTGHVGRKLHGAFYGGGGGIWGGGSPSAPSPSLSQAHPYFVTGPPSYEMRIGKPIVERAFIRSGAFQAAVVRARLWRTMEKDALRDIRLAATFRTPGARRGRRP